LFAGPRKDDDSRRRGFLAELLAFFGMQRDIIRVSVPHFVFAVFPASMGHVVQFEVAGFGGHLGPHLRCDALDLTGESNQNGGWNGFCKEGRSVLAQG
jgi:hypothetical protein